MFVRSGRKGASTSAEVRGKFWEPGVGARPLLAGGRRVVPQGGQDGIEITSRRRAGLARRLPGPALVGLGKCRDFLVAEKPGDLRDRGVAGGKVAVREIVREPGQKRREGQ